ncbi:MAG: hypothetical protein M0P00_00825 [Bacteroidaceae bacterium]|nr:hypothetical protein [Bacteroidaceae bacterium]
MEQTKEFYQLLEKGIANLSMEERGKLYRPCAISCVRKYVLKEMQRQFDECGGNLDQQYTKYGRSEYFFADIIESGHVYEIGYPRCFCPMVEQGLVKSAVHCECSRQSILFVLQTLMPEKDILVTKRHTVLENAKECRFRVVIT